MKQNSLLSVVVFFNVFGVLRFSNMGYQHSVMIGYSVRN